MAGKLGEATREQWIADAYALLCQQYGGDSVARAAASAARLYADRQPELQRVLLETGLGNHPRVVATMARAAICACGHV